MIDTHQHLIYPDEFGYSWTKDFPSLQGKFHLEDYQIASVDCEVEGTIFMEVDVDEGESPKEAAFFNQLASDPANKILGIIASARPEQDRFEQQLDKITSNSLKGIRRVLHTQPDALSQTSSFRQNIELLGKRNLCFDICVLQKQLQIALDLAQSCPNVRFVLDHCGVPDISSHDSVKSESWLQWKAGIYALSAQPNVACKFSGITAYTTPEQRTAEGLRPYLTEILENFGSKRIVWGGDWPVCNMADGLQRWCQLTDALLAELSEDEQQNILNSNARQLYRL